MTKKIDYQGLKNYLETLKYADFQKDGIVKHANDIDDIENFNLDKSKFTIDTVINHGDYFLVDALGNDLSVCKNTRKKYKLPTGRVVSMKFEAKLIDDCRKQFGSPLNGYWVIPQRFTSWSNLN